MTRNSKGQFVKQPARSDNATRGQYHIVLVALTAVVLTTVLSTYPEVVATLFPAL